MSSTLLKNKVLREIELIPDHKLPEVYNFIHYFRLGLEKAALENEQQAIMQFAGSWQDMPDETFADFTSEIASRRRQAFGERRRQ